MIKSPNLCYHKIKTYSKMMGKVRLLSQFIKLPQNSHTSS
ncbi:hypothetical protein AO382_0278 [Moraxella catarrhalis]|uniref:Uncharacterized protein n=1 Tax=Moraxella catarrhalis TaxID=480 RepID=A0A7Z0V041_MORCA|nr:hypothetical protein AO382_0278 [Moraxella catarrhalis]